MRTHGYQGPDNLLHDEAVALAKRIEEFWQGRVKCHVVQVNATATKVKANPRIWCVRSNMVNGLPPVEQIAEAA